MTTTTTNPRVQRESILREFIYKLNAMERAAQEEHPVEHDYAGKRRAVLEFVQSLADDLYPEVPHV
jgi:hypothetical protein